MKKIIVPLDFSAYATHCIRKAVELASDGSELLLVHFIELEYQPEYLVTAEFRPLTAAEEEQNKVRITEHSRAMQQAVETAAGLAEGKNIRVLSELRIGAPYPGLVHFMEKHEPDLVVIGAHTNPDHFYPMAGSLNERLMRRVAAPILTERLQKQTAGISTILYATAMEDAETALARVVRRMADVNDAVVHLTWINTPGDFQRDRPVLQFMRDFAERIGFNRFTLNTYNDLTVEDGILSFAEDLRPDLVAMATHGRTGLSRLFTRSASEEVADQASFPLLTQLIRH